MLKKLFSYERMSRLAVSLLLCLGVLWPLMWALEIQSAFLPAGILAGALTEGAPCPVCGGSCGSSSAVRPLPCCWCSCFCPAWG